jgi:HK97 family phage major capsid protein
VRTGRSVEQFKDFIISKMESRHTDTSQLHIGMNAREIKRYSFGRALVASITGNWKDAGLELECSRAVESIMGKQAEGFFVPFEYLNRDFNVGTSTEAGNLVATNLRPDMYVDALRNAQVMGRLGITYLAGLSGNVDLPRKSTAGTLGMLTEIGSASETNPVTAKATLTPHRIGAYTQVSKQALLQSAMSLENMIRDDLVTGAAVLLENQMINGAGTGAEIKGLRNVTGIGTVVGGTNGIAPAWGNFVDLESACANANAEPDRVSGYLINTKTRGKLKQTQMGTNLPFIWQNSDMPLNGYRAAITNNVPSNLTKGTSTTVCSAALFGSDWSMVTVGLFGAPDVTVDPYSLASTGQVQITLNQFADMQHRQPATTAKIDDLLS